MDINGFKLTQKAQLAIRYAQESSAEFGGIVGSEHLLIGLIREGSGVAAKYLITRGVTLTAVQGLLSKFYGESCGGGKLRIEFTPRSKNILELSVVEAQKLNNNYIGTEHLLLAILTEGEGVAIRILNNLDINISELYGAIEKALSSENPFTAPQKSREAVKKTPVLDGFGRDLTAFASSGKLDPVIGREAEIERVIQILSRRSKNNPCLIGEPGVGKTAIVEGLAQHIINGNVPETLKNKRIFTLDISSMVAGAKYRGEFEERLKKAMDEVIKSGNIILFVDEVHTLIGAGAAEGAIDAANILKPVLARGHLQLIGATTISEYRKYIEKDAALERRFQPVNIGEPSETDAIEILKGIRDKYEAHHKVTITDAAIISAVRLSMRYIPDRFLPDKAIDLIDEAASTVRVKTLTTPAELKELEMKINSTIKEKEAAIMAQEYERAARLRDEEQQLKKLLEENTQKWKNENEKNRLVISEETIAEKISEWTDVPVCKLTETDAERLKSLESILHRRIIGQDEAISAVSRAIRRSRVGLGDPNRPIGSFIFSGPTGVGKTELSKALAEAMFGSEDALIRVDMSEYMEKHSVSRMVGSPPGYVGFDEGGQLTEKVKRRPYSVVLFDEIEKAHPDVFNMLLQIMDEGMLTDAQGRKIDFKNTIIIMTSNIGARLITESHTFGFGTGNDDEASKYEHIRGNVTGELKKAFKPEFLNRVDDTIVFHPLSADEIKHIAQVMLDEITSRLKTNGIYARFTDAVTAYIAKEGFDPLYGARPLRRAIQSKVEDVLAEEILDYSISHGDELTVDCRDGKIVIQKQSILN